MSCEATKHGTTYAYKVYRCRCPEVVEYMRSRYAARREGVEPRLPDEAAIERALRGDRVRLTPAERRIVVGKLTARGMPAGEIARHVGATRRTVTRHRKSLREAA